MRHRSESPLLARLQAAAAHGGLVVETRTGARAPLGELLAESIGAGERLANVLGPAQARPVLLSYPPSLDWLRGFLAILQAGGTVVPVAQGATESELAHLASDSGANLLLGAPPAPVHVPALRLEELPPGAADAPVTETTTAMVLYTSGTTGKPKGARISHQNLAVQTRLLADAWGLDERDTLLHSLPLHHVHGITVALLTALCAGASVRVMPRFDVTELVEELGSATVWMSVPTMSRRLVDHARGLDPASRSKLAARLGALRLITSGSAALPVPLARELEELCGAIPLERYGMTEIGIVLSNALEPSARVLGAVGRPLPGVEVHVHAEAGGADRGELWVRGPTVFEGYLGAGDPRDSSGWFRTGDVVERGEDGVIRILGRASVDIIKTGGEKVSALEIEAVLLEQVAEACVIGLPDEQWGERVVAAVVPHSGQSLQGEQLVRALRGRLSGYKIPKEIRVFAALPRNAMGKLDKPAVKRAWTARGA